MQAPAGQTDQGGERRVRRAQTQAPEVENQGEERQRVCGSLSKSMTPGSVW